MPVACSLSGPYPLRHDWMRAPSSKHQIENLSKSVCYSFRSFDGTNFATINLSHYSHQHTLGLANYRGKALTTGCQEFDNCKIKTELLDMNTLQWQNGTDYPFTPSRIYRYSAASTPDAAYIIGGRYTQDIIAEFKDEKWRQLGKLQQGRQQHASISFDRDTMVVGGSTADFK